MASTVILAAQLAAGQTTDIAVTTTSWVTISAFVDDALAATVGTTNDFSLTVLQKIVTPGAGPVYQPVCFVGAEGTHGSFLTKYQRQIVLDSPGTYAVSKGPTSQKIGVQLDQ